MARTRSNFSPSEVIWLIIATFVVGLGSYGSPPLEFVAALTNVYCVILVAKGRISNYYWGLAGVLLYGFVAYKAGLYGNAGLNAFYAFMQFYGWWEWRKNKPDDQADVPVRRLSLLTMLQLGSLLFAASTILGVVFQRYTDNPQPQLDALTTVLSIVAMFLMVKRYSEQWLLWIAVNILSIVMWGIPALKDGGGYAFVAMFGVFLINSLLGAYKWYIVKTNK